MRYLPLALIALVACSQKTDKSISKAHVDSAMNALKQLADTTHALGSHSGHRYGPPTGKVRVANLLELNGTPSVAVDLYDVMHPDSTTEPLVKNLAYGQVSDYVSPRAAGIGPGSASNLYIFPTGTKQASFPYGDRVDNIGFSPDDQMTVALGPTKFGDRADISLPALDEGGHRLNSYTESLRTVPAGSALLVLLMANVNVDTLPELYLMIDGSCPLSFTSPKNQHPTSVGTEVNFHVAPGTHTLGITTSPRGHGVINCAGKKPGATTSLTVAAGQRYVVFVYGLPSDGFKVLTAQIASP